MNRKAINAIKIVAFLAVFTILFLLVQNAIVPRTDYPDHNERTARQIEGMYAEPKHTIDVLFMGNSHMRRGVSPIELYKQTGIRSYNLSTSAQPFTVSYYLAKAFFEEQSPQMVILDAGAMFYTKGPNQEPYRWLQVMDSLPWYKLPLKIEMTKYWVEIRDDDKYSVWGALFPIINYHDAFATLSKNPIRFEDPSETFYLKGHIISSLRLAPAVTDREAAEQLAEEYYAKNKSAEEQLETCPEKNRQYLARIVDLCKEHGCELVLTKIPNRVKQEDYYVAWNRRKNEITKQIAAEMGIRYIDLYSDDSMEIDWTTDSSDGGKHLNERGTVKVTKTVGRWIKENGNLEPTEATDELKASWTRSQGYSDLQSDLAMMRLTYDPVAYFSRLAEGNYTILCAVSGTLDPKGWQADDQAQFTALTGAQETMTDSAGTAYAIVSRFGQNKGEKKDAKQCVLKGKLPDGKAYTVTSKAKGAGGGATVEIAGKKYTASGDGLYIVVYDNDLHCAVELGRGDSKSAGYQFVHGEPEMNKYYQALIDMQQKERLSAVKLDDAVETVYFTDKHEEEDELAVIWTPVEGAEEYRYTVQELIGNPMPDARANESGVILMQGTSGRMSAFGIPKDRLQEGKWLKVSVRAIGGENTLSSNGACYLFILDSRKLSGKAKVYPQTGTEGEIFNTVIPADAEITGIAIAYKKNGEYINKQEYTKESDEVRVIKSGKKQYWIIPFLYQKGYNDLYERTVILRFTRDGVNWDERKESDTFVVKPRQ